MSDLDTLYDRNERFARTFDQGDLPILPRRPTMVLTCVDSRVDPAHFLGLELGDTLVLRNSGGRVTDDVEQSVALLLGMARLVAGAGAPAFSLAIVHHTDCGLEKIAAPGPRQALGQNTGLEPGVLETLAISDHRNEHPGRHRASASVRPRPSRTRGLGASVRRQEWPGEPGDFSGAPQ